MLFFISKEKHIHTFKKGKNWVKIDSCGVVSPRHDCLHTQKSIMNFKKANGGFELKQEHDYAK